MDFIAQFWQGIGLDLQFVPDLFVQPAVKRLLAAVQGLLLDGADGFAAEHQEADLVVPRRLFQPAQDLGMQCFHPLPERQAIALGLGAQGVEGVVGLGLAVGGCIALRQRVEQQADAGAVAHIALLVPCDEGPDLGALQIAFHAVPLRGYFGFKPLVVFGDVGQQDGLQEFRIGQRNAALVEAGEQGDRFFVRWHFVPDDTH